MFEIHDRDIPLRFQGAGGETLTSLCDELIYASTFSHLPKSNIRKNLRTTIADGGVDTEVNGSFSDTLLGYFNEKSVWQYKGTSKGGLKIKELFEGKYIQNKLKEGYAYRLCLADCLTAEEITNREKELNDDIQKINPNAPPALILGAGQITLWLRSYPAVVIKYFHSQYSGIFQDLNSTLTNLRDVTKNYVKVPDRQNIENKLVNHIDFSKNPTELIFLIRGNSGVGKTRFVCETINENEQAKSLTIYIDDDSRAVEIANVLSMNADTKAIIIVDECSLEVREKIKSKLRGYKSRLRIICIENEIKRFRSPSPIPELSQIPYAILAKILADNFPYIAYERRNAYMKLSEGFVFLAADLCEHDHEFSDNSTTGLTIPSIDDYYARRMGDASQQKVIEAISLISRLGFKDDVSHELDKLCDFLGMSRIEFQEIAFNLCNVGFIKIAGRFLYVTPAIISRVAFRNAWVRWGSINARNFLANFPSLLIGRFQERVSQSATEEVRQIVADFFREWIAHIGISDLSDFHNLMRVINLIEINPEENLKQLRQIIEKATDDEIQQVPIGWDRIGNEWGSRRQLVFLCERIYAFKELFYDAEIILRKLALNETENDIGNNATSIWSQLFRIYLSGTEIPFPERLNKLEKYLNSSLAKEQDLAFNALGACLKYRSIKDVGPSVVAGRIVPPEWYPTEDEVKISYDLIIKLTKELIFSSNKDTKSKALTLVINNTRFLLRQGYLNALKSVFKEVSISTEQNLSLCQEISEFLEFEGSPDENIYSQETEEWLLSLIPNDLHGRVVHLVGIDPWEYFNKPEGHENLTPLTDLARDLIANLESLKNECDWLFSSKAKSARFLGLQIGRLDYKGVCLDIIVSAAQNNEYVGVACGYLTSLVDKTPKLANKINQFLDKIEKTKPELVPILSLSSIEALQAIRRTLDLIKEEKISINYFMQIIYGDAFSKLSDEDLEFIFNKCINSSSHANQNGFDIGLKLLGNILHHSPPESMKISSALKEVVWKFLLEAPEKMESAADVVWWQDALKKMFKDNPKSAALISVIGLKNLSFKHEATEILIENAVSFPVEVISAFDREIFEKANGKVDFYILNTLKSIFSNLPIENMTNWLDARGVELSRILARHLPLPYVKDTKPCVPELTGYVLTKYEDDDLTFNEFCCGAHSGQMYSGNIADQHLKEAEVAEMFKGHQLRRIREWSKREYDFSKKAAEQWNQIKEEWQFGDR